MQKYFNLPALRGLRLPMWKRGPVPPGTRFGFGSLLQKGGFGRFLE